MTKTSTTSHLDSQGNRIEVETKTYDNGAAKITVRENPDFVFKGGVKSITEIDKDGNSRTRDF